MVCELVTILTLNVMTIISNHELDHGGNSLPLRSPMNAVNKFTANTFVRFQIERR